MFYQTGNARRPAKGPKNAVLSLVTLTFKLIRAKDQTRLPCEFGANPFSDCRYISYTKKKHRVTAPKTEPSAVHCVLPRAVTNINLN